MSAHNQDDQSSFPSFTSIRSDFSFPPLEHQPGQTPTGEGLLQGHPGTLQDPHDNKTGLSIQEDRHAGATRDLHRVPTGSRDPPEEGGGGDHSRHSTPGQATNGKTWHDNGEGSDNLTGGNSNSRCPGGGGPPNGQDGRNTPSAERCRVRGILDTSILTPMSSMVQSREFLNSLKSVTSPNVKDGQSSIAKLRWEVSKILGKRKLPSFQAPFFLLRHKIFGI